MKISKEEKKQLLTIVTMGLLIIFILFIFLSFSVNVFSKSIDKKIETKINCTGNYICVKEINKSYYEYKNEKYYICSILFNTAEGDIWVDGFVYMVDKDALVYKYENNNFYITN